MGDLGSAFAEATRMIVAADSQLRCLPMGGLELYFADAG